LAVALGASAFGCTSYQYARNIPLVAYQENIEKGKAVGPVRGADCTWYVLGYALGGPPTLDKAMSNAKQGAGESVKDAIGGGEAKFGTAGLRYLNNVSTEHDGFNAGVVGKQCLIVKGAGYQ